MALLYFSAKATTYNNSTTNCYDMWRCETPFPQINKLQLGSFPTIINRPVNSTIHLQLNKEAESIEDSPVSNNIKKKKCVVKKPVNLGPCFFPHACLCGHKVSIRDLCVNSRQRRNPSSVTIQTRTSPVKIGLRNK
jgi:hypothetical protein